LPVPEFVEHCGGIMAIIRRTKITNFASNVTDYVTDNVTDNVVLSANQIKILKLILEDGNVSLSQLSLALSLTKRTIQRNVSLLQELNFVFREGNNKSGKWCLTEEAKNKIQKL
jgi:predicted HTH transcriptional regulator